MKQLYFSNKQVVEASNLQGSDGLGNPKWPMAVAYTGGNMVD